MTSWDVIEHEGSAGSLHRLDVADGADRAVWRFRPTAPALVLGSTQREDVVDREALRVKGVDLVRRRSGGGAVLLQPLDVALWVDVVLPRTDRLWCDDVGRASHWVGEVWTRALHRVGVDGEVHRDGIVHRPWSGLICFAGLGPGEVVVGRRKLVGLAQRRTRAGARFQTVVLRRWNPDALLDLLALDPSERKEAGRALGPVAVGTEVSGDALLEAFVGALPIN